LIVNGCSSGPKSINDSMWDPFTQMSTSNTWSLA
jgi:hypothetical protein